MKAIEFKNKKGDTRFKIEISSSEFSELSSDGGGFCIACGEEASGVEPDARGYECECCDANKVYGLEELLMMGFVSIVEESEA